MIDRLQSYFGKKFLIVDDIADTGKTLEKLFFLFLKFIKLTFTTIHYHKQSSVEPSFWVEEKGDDWDCLS